MEWMNLGLAVGAGVFAGFVNTVAGGGSLLTLPLLIFLGLPPAAANATNRVAIFVQNIASVSAFQRQQLVNWKLSIPLGISALVGATLGARFSITLDEDTFNRVIAIIIVLVVVMMLFKSKTYSPEQAIAKKSNVVGIIIFFFVGIYGGFIQAGVGFLMMAALNRYYKIDLVRTNAIKVTVALIYTAAALAVFIWADLIDWKFGLALAAGNAAGAWWASYWSVQKGEKGIRIVVAVMALAMAVKLWIDTN
ncbi:MAG: sulfite exporter TauE/SafE family protein [Candidatus Cyclobacteriaceae bacterium M2_1C_046]